MPAHRVVAADVHSVPRPFSAFAVRSEEPRHAMDARSPWGQVHRVRTDFLDADALARCAAEGLARTTVETFSDIEHALTNLDELAPLAPDVPDLGACIADSLRQTGVLGEDAADYRHSLDTRIDFLATCGAGFHNDVGRHWSRCLFWTLALAVADVEFVMPHAGVRLALAPGDLLVFDPAMAHGLCRPRDLGQAVAASFEPGPDCRQVFLTGELLLDDAQWAGLGAPWLPVEQHERRGALDLTVAEFDDRSGAIKQLRAMRDCMKRSTCHVDDAAG
jgi:hypothetical protein